jgi:hypothetical protein
VVEVFQFHVERIKKENDRNPNPMDDDSPRHHRIYCSPWLTWAQERYLRAAAALLPPVSARGKKLSCHRCARSGSGVESLAVRAGSFGRHRGRRPPLPVRSERVDKVEATADDPSRIDLGLEHG